MSTKARTSIRAQLMRLSLVIVVVSIALSLVGTLSYTLHTEQQSAVIRFTPPAGGASALHCRHSPERFPD